MNKGRESTLVLPPDSLRASVYSHPVGNSLVLRHTDVELLATDVGNVGRCSFTGSHGVEPRFVRRIQNNQILDCSHSLKF